MKDRTAVLDKLASPSLITSAVKYEPHVECHWASNVGNYRESPMKFTSFNIDVEMWTVTYYDDDEADRILQFVL